MITEKEYRKAIKIITAYKEQINKEVAPLVEKDDSKLLEKGQKIKIIFAHFNSNVKSGDILTVVDSYYNWKYNINPIIIAKTSDNKKKIIIQERGWHYEVIKERKLK
jgi:hypothetical protein